MSKFSLARAAVLGVVSKAVPRRENFRPEKAVMGGSAALSDLTQAAVEATITATKPIKRGSCESRV